MKNLLIVIDCSNFLFPLFFIYLRNGCSNLLLPECCCGTKQFPHFLHRRPRPHHQLYPCCRHAHDPRETHTLPRGSTRIRARVPASQPTLPAHAAESALSLLARLQASTSKQHGAGRAGPHPRAAPAAGHSRLGPRGPAPTPVPGPRRVAWPHVAGTRRVGRRGPGGAHGGERSAHAVPSCRTRPPPPLLAPLSPFFFLPRGFCA